MLLRGRLLLRLRLWLRFRSHLVTSARCGVNELSQTALMAHSNAAWQQTPPRLDAFACCTRALATAVGEKKKQKAGLSTGFSQSGDGKTGRIVWPSTLHLSSPRLLC